MSIRWLVSVGSLGSGPGCLLKVEFLDKEVCRLRVNLAMPLQPLYIELSSIELYVK
jgi:hypothetical protein